MTGWDGRGERGRRESRNSIRALRLWGSEVLVLVLVMGSTSDAVRFRASKQGPRLCAHSMDAGDRLAPNTVQMLHFRLFNDHMYIFSIPFPFLIYLSNRNQGINTNTTSPSTHSIYPSSIHPPSYHLTTLTSPPSQTDSSSSSRPP